MVQKKKCKMFRKMHKQKKVQRFCFVALIRFRTCTCSVVIHFPGQGYDSCRHIICVRKDRESRSSGPPMILFPLGNDVLIFGCLNTNTMPAAMCPTKYRSVRNTRLHFKTADHASIKLLNKYSVFFDS